jgi:UDP-2,3-diacylglucosamine pyrophosphatase LpxH
MVTTRRRDHFTAARHFHDSPRRRNRNDIGPIVMPMRQKIRIQRPTSIQRRFSVIDVSGRCPTMTAPSHRMFRAMFISDVHLGTRGCRAEQLLDFLRWHDAETIYLVGDIVDGWQLRYGWHWPQSHNDVVQKLLRKGRKGTRLVYVPGNHDEFLRDYCGLHFGGVEVTPDAIHVAADGRRYIVTHGDQFDLVVKNARWLAYLGDHAYTFALALNTTLNLFRRRLGLPYWSISRWAKVRVKEAVNYIGEFEKMLSVEADRHRTSGVICGHIHHASIRHIGEVRYVNCGDWVESCSAAVEHHNGDFEILTWTSATSLDAEDAAAMEVQAA